MILGCVATPGCGARPVTASWFKHSRSYDYEGQKVELNMLTYADMRDYAKIRYPDNTELQDEWAARLKEDFPRLQWDREAAPLIALPILLGYGIDFLKAELEREASLYEAQFGASIHETGFWEAFTPIKVKSTDDQGNETEEVVGYKGIPRWLGFEIVRTTSRDQSDGGKPAARIAFAMIPANYFARHESLGLPHGSIASKSDERLFVIKPMWLEINRSRAKVASSASAVDVSANIRMSAIWIDGSQRTHRDTIADADFEFPGVGLSTSEIHMDEFKNKIAGWFGGVPVSFDTATKEPKGDGTFQLAVSITESDPSKVREIIERTAKYLGDHKEEIIQSIGVSDAN